MQSIGLCRSLLKDTSLSPETAIQILAELMKAYALEHDFQGLQKSRQQMFSLIRLSPPNKTPRQRLYLTGLAAEAYLLCDDWKTARFILEEARRQLADDSEQETLFEAHLLQLEGVVYVMCDRLPEAESMFKRAVVIQEKINDRAIVAGYLGLAYIAYKNGNINQAHIFRDKALSKSQAEWTCCPAEIQSGELELFLAGRLGEEGDLAGARRCLKQAQSLPQLTKEQQESARNLEKQLSGAAKLSG